MPREISDEEYQYYQNQDRVANFVNSIWNDPALSKDAKRLVKRKYPQLPIPDFDIEEKVEQRFQAEDKRRTDEDRATKQKKQEEEWKAQRDEVQKEYGYSDENMGELEKFMTEHNVGNYKVAASYRSSKSPRPSEPTSGHGQPWGYSQNEKFREVAKDPEAWGRGEIMKAIYADQERAKQLR